MKKFMLFLFGFILFMPMIVSADEYEAMIIINNISSSTVVGEYYYDTLEEAVADLPIKEAVHNTSNKSGVVTVTLQLLNDSIVDKTLVINTNKSNMMLDVNGKSITSSADPVIQAGTMTFIVNKSGEDCFIVQKNVTNVSTVSPNTIIYAPSSTFTLSIAADNLTIGDKTGTAVYSRAMLPSIMGGTFLGKMDVSPAMFGSAVSGGYFLEDPTSLIDTNAYIAVKNSDNLYYLIKYHASLNDSNGTLIKKYGFLQDAVDAAKLGEIVKLLKFDHPNETVMISEDDNINLDLAGFELTGAVGSLTPTVGNHLVTNKGILNISDSSGKSRALNYVSERAFDGDVFSTINNQGTLNINGIGVYVNYNQPDYTGNIYTLYNDSSSSDAIINIDGNSRIGGLYLEMDDPATGKYNAIRTKGEGLYKNEINITYGDDLITFTTENSIINEVMNTFDTNGNYVTNLSLVDDELLKDNIVIRNNDNEVNFSYDEDTDTLTIPASEFTSGVDKITIGYQFLVTYMVDGKAVSTNYVDAGDDAIAPSLPSKTGYTASWDNNGKKILKNTTIKAVYLSKNPNTSDSIITYIALMIISLTIISTLLIKRKALN